MGLQREMSLEQLVRGCCNNDSNCQQMLFKRYYGLMMSICLRYTGSTHDAKDIIQLGFLKIFEKLPELHDYSSAEGWMKRIMVNSALDFLRRRNSGIITVNPATEEALEWHSGGQSFDVELEGNTGITESDILEAIQELPEAYRTVFNLFVIEGMTHDEISEILEISSGTSKSNLSKARKRLQEQLLKKNEINAKYA